MAAIVAEPPRDDLAQPLCPTGGGGSGDRPHVDGEENSAHRPSWVTWLGFLMADAAASVAFWYSYVLLLEEMPSAVWYAGLSTMVVAMVLWRFRSGARGPQGGPLAKAPYSCGFVSHDGKELYVVATVHISPKSPKDVNTVIGTIQPDLAMIELDEERLAKFTQQPKDADQKDLQPLHILEASGSELVTSYAQRALWNAERSGETISAKVLFDETDPYGIKCSSEELRGNLALVHRGGPEGCSFATFAFKAHKAARAGAEGVLVINAEKEGDCLPRARLGAGPLLGELKVAWAARTCSFPPIPLLLLPHSAGERLREQCLRPGPSSMEEGNADSARVPEVSFEIRPDSFARRTLPRRLCQGCSLMFSGIGVLYGIIDCFKVDVGKEFSAAEEAASARGIPCVCIDVDMNKFWGRLGRTLLPTPRNLLNSFLSWLCFPRLFFRLLFPPMTNVDVLGSTFVHAFSFSCRTWVAFILAGVCASFVMSTILNCLTLAPVHLAAKAGVVSDEEGFHTYVMLLLEFYALPQIYDAVAASRDEAMYNNIVAKSRERKASRLVAVVGAAHSNGILQRARTRGL